MAKEAEEIDNEQLQTKLAEILESYPLYREYCYKGANQNRLPALIQHFCQQCEKRTEWQNTVGRTPNDKIQFQQRHYRCRNCKEQMIYFAYSWYEIRETVDGKEERISLFSKYGQSPE